MVATMTQETPSRPIRKGLAHVIDVTVL